MYKPNSSQPSSECYFLAETDVLAAQPALPEKLALVAATGLSLNGRRTLQAWIGRHSVAGHRIVL